MSTNYYLGVQRGAAFIDGSITAGTSSNGGNSDIEIRMQIVNGATATGLTRQDVILALDQFKNFISEGGINGAGANLPP